MAALTQAEAQATLDARFPTAGASDYLGYSTDGVSETTFIDRTFIGAAGWAPATATLPSVKSNNALLTSAASEADNVIVSHVALFTASTGGTQRTLWTALPAPRELDTGDQMQWPVGTIDVTME
jgi:hypothetical protein